jgi:hypothetical protein
MVPRTTQYPTRHGSPHDTDLAHAGGTSALAAPESVAVRQHVAAQRSTVQHQWDLTLAGRHEHGATQHNTLQHSTACCNKAQHVATEHNTLQHSTSGCSAAQHFGSTARPHLAHAGGTSTCETSKSVGAVTRTSMFSSSQSSAGMFENSFITCNKPERIGHAESGGATYSNALQAATY